MEERIERAREKHMSGCNCAQAVLCAYADLFGVDEETAYRISEAFGRGMGNMSGMCGAVSGALMVAGLAFSEGSQAAGNKKETYDVAARIVSEFKEKNGSIICRELKGMDGGKPLRSCRGCIEDAAMIAGEILHEQEKI